LGAPYPQLNFSLENAPSNVSISGVDALGRKIVTIGPPGPDLAGVRSYRFDALVTDPSGLTDRKHYQLINDDASTLGSPPAVTAPVTATTTEGDTLRAQVSASDPDGDAIAVLSANLSSLPLGSGATFVSGPNHTSGQLTWPTAVGQSGTYVVTFQATTSLGGGAVFQAFGLQPIIQSGFMTTTIKIEKAITARTFTAASDKIIRLFSDKPTWCAYVEPMNTSFSLDEIDPSTVSLVSTGTGSAGQIFAKTGKTLTAGDKDRNGVPDEAFCFAKEDLRALFAGIQGRREVTARLDGRLTSGEQFGAALELSVIAGDGEEDDAEARVSPNPLNPEGTLSLHVSKPGPVTVRLFDTRGRLVRTLLATQSGEPGKIEVRVDAHDATGATLASGVYLLRVSTPDRISTARFVVMK
jgi:hypothetical protein